MRWGISLITSFAAILSAAAFIHKPAFFKSLRPSSLNMNTIAEGVQFDTVAREWRCKWSPDGDKASLVACQTALDTVLADLKNIAGVTNVERIVCGGCLDFKVIISLSADKFGDWEGASFAPEKEFLEMLGAIDGVSQIETQTYTKMPMM